MARSRSPTLRLLQGIAIAVLLRDAKAACQGLQVLSDLCPDREGEQVLRQLVANLSPQERFWLGSLHGERKRERPSQQIMPDESNRA